MSQHEELEAFNPDEYQHGFEKIPDGKYLCRLVGLDVKDPKTPDGGEASEAKWEILRGDQQGRNIVLFYDLTEYAPSEAALAKNPKAKKACFGLTALIDDFARGGSPLLDGKERIYKSAIENNRLYLKKFGEKLMWIELRTVTIRGGKRKGEDRQERRILEPHTEAESKPTRSLEPKKQEQKLTPEVTKLAEEQAKDQAQDEAREVQADEAERQVAAEPKRQRRMVI